jgi:hypothetical protein
MTLTALLLLAQTVTVTIKPATPFTITWDQPTQNTFQLKYRLWCDGAIVKNYAVTEVTAGPDNADGTTPETAIAPGLAAGTHSCFVSAYNDLGEAKSDAIPLTVGVTPGTPLRLRVVVTVGGGGL